MELSVKTSVLFILALLSTSMGFAGFQLWKISTSASIQSATSYYDAQKVDVNTELAQIKFPKLTVRSQTIPQYTMFDAKSIAHAYDEQDGDISGQIDVYGEVNTHVVKDYELRYVVRNSYGLKSVKNIVIRVN